MKIAQVAWYARRARTMEPGELRARVFDALDGVVDYARWRFQGRSGYQRNLDPQRFQFCRAAEPSLPALSWHFEPSTAQVGDMLAGVHHALGFAWQWRPEPEAWHRAPDTGALWPMKYSGLIAHRPGNEIGDVRVIWEPNRLQQLVVLALLARTVPEAADRAVALLKLQLHSWSAANPMRCGVNYISAMECALRILSVSFASDLARPFLLRDPAYWASAAKLILEHAAFVNARLSLFSSLGNHTVAECAGLFVAALMFPEFERAAAWEARSHEVLERAAQRVISADGGAAEQALHYHAQVLDHIEIAIRVGRHCRRDVSVLESLHRSGSHFLSLFHAGRKSLPAIGDDDEGHALSPFFVSSWAAEAARKAEARPNAAVSMSTVGDYSIVRSGEDAAVLIFDHGPLGMPPNCGHGHADALSVQLSIRGEPVLVDPGTLTYGGDARWRHYFRGTSAHNTVTVDGQDQARQAGPFLWGTSYTCGLLYDDLKHERSAALVARHDGYGPLGVRHTRALRLIPGAVLVLDRLDGEGTHELALRWHFARSVRFVDGSFQLDSLPGFQCRVQGGEARLLQGSSAPIGGWRSERYGAVSPICTLEVRSNVTLPHEFVTVFLLNADHGGFDAAAEASLMGNLLDALSAQETPRRGSEPVSAHYRY